MKDRSGMVMLVLVLVLVVMSVASTFMTLSSIDGTAPVDGSPVASGKVALSVREPSEPVISTGKVGVIIEEPGS